MSSIDLRVELPAFSQSFQIQVPLSSSVLNVKEEVKRKCPGAPQVEGQRLIWRGRFLKDDEKVTDIWKSPNDAPVVHLAVHPSAWTDGVPASAATQAPASLASPSPLPTPRQQQPTPAAASLVMPPPMGGASLPYIIHKHNTAIHVLVYGNLPPPGPNDIHLPLMRQHAISIVHSYGWSWPNVLDADYPPSDESAVGLKYEQVILDNYPYLSLTTPNASPTPLQTHALKILTHSFALLAIPSFDPTFPPPPVYQNSFPVSPPTNLNDHLRQMGMPPLRVVPNQNNPNQNPNDPNNALAAAEIRALPLRALMMPLMMLTFRTLILMYFFSPSKRPLFGILLSAWILYEAWGAFRAVLGGDQPGADGQARGGNGQAGGDAQGQAGQPGQNVQQAAGAGNSNQGGRTFMNALMDKLSSLNLGYEDRALHGNPNHTERSLIHKVQSLVLLFAMTLHPAVWDRRRALLRRREGYVRTEANARDAADPTDGDETSNAAHAHARSQLVARYERKATWVKDYIQRVLNTEWVDEA